MNWQLIFSDNKIKKRNIKLKNRSKIHTMLQMINEETTLNANKIMNEIESYEWTMDDPKVIK